MVEAIIAIVILVGSFTGGYFVGISGKPTTNINTQIMEVHNAYQVETRQATTTEVFQGQITITAVDTKGVLTNINFNVKDYTNMIVNFTTNSNMLYTITNSRTNK